MWSDGCAFSLADASARAAPDKRDPRADSIFGITTFQGTMREPCIMGARAEPRLGRTPDLQHIPAAAQLRRAYGHNTAHAAKIMSYHQAFKALRWVRALRFTAAVPTSPEARDVLTHQLRHGRAVFSSMGGHRSKNRAGAGPIVIRTTPGSGIGQSALQQTARWHRYRCHRVSVHAGRNLKPARGMDV